MLRLGDEGPRFHEYWQVPLEVTIDYPRDEDYFEHYRALLDATDRLLWGSARTRLELERILSALRDRFDVAPASEITLEINPGSVNEAIRVLQLNVPLVCRYWVVYQNVQSSLGSIVMLL